MVWSSQLKAVNKERDNVLKILSIMIVPAPFVAVGLGMLIGGIKNGPFFISLIGLVIAAVGIFLGRILFKSVLDVKNKAYELFNNNDVFVSPHDPKLRAVERIALEKFNGDLKWALHYVVASPELHRQERVQNMVSWCDYERDYIYKYYGKHPLRVAEHSRTDTLTIEIIERDLSALSRKYRQDPPDFTVLKACCTGKGYSPGIDGASDTHYLHFGTHGSCECSQSLHSITYVGEEFYIVTVAERKAPSLIYPVAEWTPNQALEYLMSDAE